MATITVNKDNSLSLELSADERSTYDVLPDGQLAGYVTIWLGERFKTSWQARIDKLTNKQKKELAALLKDAITPDVQPG